MRKGSGQHGEGEWSADLHTVIGEVITWWEGRGGMCVCVDGCGCVGVGVWVCACVVCINC